MNMDDEIICGHFVTAEKKRINAVYLDLLKEFDRLCQQAGLTYWVAFGTLLGTIRHKGFIPWDDDVDIWMPRSDFNRLLHMPNEEFGTREPYFLQNYNTDPNYFQTLMRFRRSDTTAIMDYDLCYLRAHGPESAYNMGINLTIFALSRYPKFRPFQILQPKLGLLLEAIESRAIQPAHHKPFRRSISRLLVNGLGHKNYTRVKNWLYCKCPKPADESVQCYYLQYPEYTLFPMTAFQETLRLPFEDFLVPVPVGYECILSLMYGNYMEFPPEEARVEQHDGYFNAEIPYLTNIHTRFFPDNITKTDNVASV